MILVTISVSVRGESDDDAREVAANIKENFRSTLSDSPYDASISFCQGVVIPDDEVDE